MSGGAVIACVGAGRMGRGIAHVFAAAGHRVTLIDAKPRAADDSAALLTAARDEIRGDLAFLAGLGHLTKDQGAAIMDRIECAGREQAGTALAAADFIFEAVRELHDAKQDAFDLINEAAGDNAVVSSTTSTMPVGLLSHMLERPARFINAHWLNPAWLMPLVEVSKSDDTDPATVEALTALLEEAGKVPVLCAATPGYIVPRLQALMMNECARMIEEGVAEAAEIDKAIRTGFGVRYAVLGALEFVDWGGGDILYYASRHLQENLDKERYAMPAFVERMIEDGKTGMDAGEGFYDFRDTDVAEYRRRRLGEFVRLIDFLGYLPSGVKE